MSSDEEASHQKVSKVTASLDEFEDELFSFSHVVTEDHHEEEEEGISTAEHVADHIPVQDSLSDVLLNASQSESNADISYSAGTSSHKAEEEIDETDNDSQEDNPDHPKEEEAKTQSSLTPVKPKLPKGKARAESIAGILKNPEESALRQSKPRRPPAKTVVTIEHSKGPLSLLHRAFNERIPVCVYLRNRTGLNRKLKAYIAAFDKHFNMALTDVDEVYYRKSRTHVYFKNRLDETSDVPMALRYLSLDKHYKCHTETVQRHCNQLFIKGDNVILVHLVT